MKKIIAALVFFPAFLSMMVAAGAPLENPLQAIESQNIHGPGTLYAFRAPSKFLVQKVGGILKISIDKNSFKNVNVGIHTNMIVGMWCDIRVSESGKTKSSKMSHNLEPSIGGFMPGLSKTNRIEFDIRPYFWRPDGDGIARPLGYSAPWLLKKEGNVLTNGVYSIEMDLTLFETDSRRVGQNWTNNASEFYRIIWEKKLNTKY